MMMPYIGLMLRKINIYPDALAQRPQRLASPDRDFALAADFERVGGDRRPISQIPDDALLEGFGEEVEDVVVRRGQKPVARIAAITENEPVVRRKPGSMRGRIRVRDDFDEWPPDIERALGIID